MHHDRRSGPDSDERTHAPVQTQAAPGKHTLAGALATGPAAHADEPGAVAAHAAAGTATPASALPFQDTIQRAFGRHDLGGIQAHQGPEAAASARAMGAEAYATGGHVVLGDRADLHTVAHEAAHVVQQRGGLKLAGGVGQVGDPHERHADAVADRVVAGESAEALLDTYGGAGGGADAGAGGGVQRLTSKANQDELALGDFYHLAAAGLLDGALNINFSGEDEHKKAKYERFFQRVVGAGYAPSNTKSRNSTKATDSLAKRFKNAPDQGALHQTIRTAFLRDVPEEARGAIQTFLSAQLGEAGGGGGAGGGGADGGAVPVIPPKVLLWVRANDAHGADRNTTPELIQLMLGAAADAALVPVMIGEPVPEAAAAAVAAAEAKSLTQFWTAQTEDGGSLFGGVDNVQKQLTMLDLLRTRHHVVAQIGVKSGAMDGPALMGLPTLVLDREPDPEKQRRMAKWGNTMSCYHVFYPDEGTKKVKQAAEVDGDQRAAVANLRADLTALLQNVPR